MLALAAQPGEGELAAIYPAAAGLPDFLPQAGNGDLVQVQHRIAAGADEMDMGIGVGIESLNAPDGGDALDQTLLLEPGQIPVDRCQRNVGMLNLEHFVDHFRGGVGIRALQAGEDRVALFELLCLNFHRHLLFRVLLRLILIYKLSISCRSEFVKKKIRIIRILKCGAQILTLPVIW